MESVKILILGDSGVGKSTLLSAYVDEKIPDRYHTTIGVDFRTKDVTLEQTGQIVRLQIWDSAGQERFHKIVSSYYRGAQAILLVFDLAYRDSWTHLNFWMNQIEEHLENKIPIILIGNKKDLQNRRIVSSEEITRWTEQHQIKYFEISARSFEGLQPIFQCVAEQVIQNRNLEQQKETGRISLSSVDQTNCLPYC